MGDERISPTAYYTGEVWVRSGLSHPALSTWQGRAFLAATRPFGRAAAWASRRPGLEAHLVARHVAIDAVLERAIAEGRVGQVLELAAGLSPRGMRLLARHESLRYVEADLPGMAEQKRKLLTAHGLLGSRHRLVHVDAFSDGELSIAAVAARELDPDVGVAVITEGLLSYVDPSAVPALFARIRGVLAMCPSGLYLSDLAAGDTTRPTATRAFRHMLSAFTRGTVHIHPVPDALRWLAGDGLEVRARLPRHVLEDEGMSTPVPDELLAMIQSVDSVRVLSATAAAK